MWQWGVMARAGAYMGGAGEAHPPQGRRDKLQVPLCPLCGVCGGVRLVRVRMETDPHRGYWVLGEVWESESGWNHRGACWDQDRNWASSSPYKAVFPKPFFRGLKDVE